jgi:calpain
LIYSEDIVVKQTNFLPVSVNTLECSVGGEQQELNKNGYIIMPSTYQSKIHGTFLLSVKSDKPFELTPIK